MPKILEKNKIVKRGADYDWLRSIALTEKDIREINGFERNEIAMTDGKISKSQRLVILQLDGFKIAIREREAPAQLKVFTEIFKEDLHFLVNDFYREIGR